MIGQKLRSKKARLALMAALLACLVVGTGVAVALANPTAVNWNVVSGGGQVSAGGKYSLSGTVGQGEISSAMTGGPAGAVYSLSGGYWTGLPSTLIYFPSVKK